MAKTFDTITDDLRELIAAQAMFFVATAPLDGDGHVNVSPKGLDTFRVLGPRRVAYLDLTGSGNETAAHLLENGRVTFLFCAFSGPPKILRLYGRGRAVLSGDPDWDELVAGFPAFRGTRQVIDVAVERIQTSCGFGIPLYDYRGDRDTLPRWAESKGDDGLAAYQREKNRHSIDGLPTPFASR